MNTDPKEFGGDSFDTPPVSTGEVLKDELTEEQKQIAWAEFEAEMRELDNENNLTNYK